MRDMAQTLALMTPSCLPPGGLRALCRTAPVILVFATEDDARLDRQIDLLEAHGTGRGAPCPVVIVDTGTGGALRERFQPAGFAVIVLGPDGEEACRADRVLGPDRLGLAREDFRPAWPAQPARRAGRPSATVLV